MPGDSSDDPATLLRPRLDASPLPEGAFILEAIEGPDTGLRFSLDASQPARVMVGTGPACELCLTDREVSRRHVALEHLGRRIRVSDLGSTNGTFVDGVAIVTGYMRDEDILRIGGTAFRVEHVASASTPEVPTTTRFGRLIGASTEMRRLYPLFERLAASSVPVIIEGETGTGKELCAEALHEQGPRAGGPFVVFDCTAVPASLMEAELFGHERGAFTGAVGSREGLLEQAHGGTLLIDEIGDLDAALQPKLLRAIERSEARRLGGKRARLVDVRIIAATRRDLDREVQAGRFRDDLFHRIAVARVELPPLRERRGDVSLLAQHFAHVVGGDGSALDREILLRWEDYDWPGNVRELRNAVARRIALGDLARATSPVSGRAPRGPLDDALLELTFPEARRRALDQFERRYVQKLLERHGGNVAKAAEAAGIARRYFQLIKARSR